MRDKRNAEIRQGDSVLVDDPGPGDLWPRSFRGTVDGVDHADWWVVVVDQGGETFWINPLDLEVIEHKGELDADEETEI